MRIAFLTTEYLNQNFFTGGLANYLRRTATELVRRGHQVEVFTFSSINYLSEEDGIMVHEIKNFIPRIYPLRHTYIANTVDSTKLFHTFLRIHRQHRFDVIQAANNKACGLIAALANAVPVVTRVSSYQRALRRADATRNRPTMLQRERLENLQRKYSPAVYAPSVQTAKEINRSAITVVDVIEPPFVPEVESFASIDGILPFRRGRYGLYYGRLEYLKGCDRLLEVLPGLLQDNPEMSFVFVGSPEKHLQQPAFDQELRVGLSEFANRIAVLPALRHVRLMPVVRGSRFVVLPSRSENLSNACMEAMAQRRVVVATQDASFDQLIDHGTSGYLVPQDDNDALARTIQKVWTTSRSERDTIGGNAFRALARLHPDVTIPNLVDYYQKIIDRGQKQKFSNQLSYRIR